MQKTTYPDTVDLEGVGSAHAIVRRHTNASCCGGHGVFSICRLVKGVKELKSLCFSVFQVFPKVKANIFSTQHRRRTNVNWRTRCINARVPEVQDTRPYVPHACHWQVRVTDVDVGPATAPWPNFELPVLRTVTVHV
jgi:hypothetical protein